MTERAKRKLRDVRTVLQTKHKVFARLALGKDDVLVDWIPTAATDGRRHYWNPAFVESTPLDQLVGTKVHESLHDRCGHSLRRGAIPLADWNIDADLAINPHVLRDAGLLLPDGALFDARFVGLSAEKIHAIRTREQEQAAQADQDDSDDSKESDDQQDGADAGQQDGQDGDQDGQDASRSDDSGDDSDGDRSDESGRDDNGAPDQDDESDAGDDQAPGPGQDDQDGQESDTDDGADAGQSDQDGQQDGDDSSNGDGQDGEQAASGPTAPDGREIPDCVGGIMDYRNDDGTEPTPDEIAELDRENRQAMQDAIRIGKQAGCMPAGFEAYVDAATESRVDWRDAIQEFATELSRADWSWKRPHKGQLVVNGIYAPSLSQPGLGPLVVACDASGSVGDSDFAQCLGEVATVHAMFAPSELWILQFDGEVQHAACYAPGEDLSESIGKRRGFGGTCFQPVFDWLADNGVEPAGVVVLTDLGNSDRGQMIEPEYPVLWVSVDPQAPDQAFGRRVDML